MNKHLRGAALLACVTLSLVSCGEGDPGALSAADQEICDEQAADLGDVRNAVGQLVNRSRWAPGEAAETTELTGSAVTTLSGYVVESEAIARSVDRARTDLQTLYDDLADDETLSGDGLTARTAEASLSALESACA